MPAHGTPQRQLSRVSDKIDFAARVENLQSCALLLDSFKLEK
jgi:hypothetical protein